MVDCDIVATKFELLSFINVHFWTNNLGEVMNLLIHPAMGYMAPLQRWIWHQITHNVLYDFKNKDTNEKAHICIIKTNLASLFLG